MICLPLGAMQLCLVSSDSVTPRSWEEYDKLVESWGGEAAEPTAKGWSAYSFLCRCSGIRRWLFEGETLRSLLDEQDYVNCLEQNGSHLRAVPEKESQSDADLELRF